MQFEKREEFAQRKCVHGATLHNGVDGRGSRGAGTAVHALCGLERFQMRIMQDRAEERRGELPSPARQMACTTASTREDQRPSRFIAR